MERYDSYKDSGVEWIGKIPSHWENFNLGNIFTVSGRIGWKNLRSDEYVDEPNYIFLSTPNLKGKEIDFVNVNYITKERYDESPEIMLELDDILLVKSGSTLGIVNIIRELPKPTTVNGSSVVLKKRNESEVGSFYNYLMGSNYFQNLMKITQGGVGVPSVNQSDIRKFKLLKPPISEQQQIVSFLDTKTSLIDSLIEKTQRKIELLKEKRTTLINEVVTKGLNPNVEMKDSGFERIGEIPISWTVPKMSYLLKGITDGTHGTHERVNEGELFLSSKNVTNKGIFIGENESQITPEEHEKIVKKGYPIKGDILITVVGSIGRSCVYEYDYPISFQRSVCFLRFKETINEYFMNFLIQSDVIQFQLLKNTKKSTQGGIYMNDLKRFDMILPSITEQQQIVEYLDEKTQLIDKTVSIEEKRIELLKEYRQSLISEVVTGKRKVV